MRSRMHPRYYLSQEIFEREQDKIFRKLWLFAGLKVLLPKHNSFITRKIAGIPVVIQNFHGKLHAFENVCLHRSAPLQAEPVGCRPLVCPYHAWRYDASGQVDNIPFCDSLYQFDAAEMRGMKLREFPLREVGNLLFIHVGDAPRIALEEQFSLPFLEQLEDSSNSYDTEVMVTTWHCRFNWKLVYENLRDFNHVSFVHPKTLAPYARFNSPVDAELARETLASLPDATQAGKREELRNFSFGGAEGSMTEIPHFPWHDQVERWRAKHLDHTSDIIKRGIETLGPLDNPYFNWLAFPNLHIACGDGGHSFAIEHHVPVGPDRTDLEIYRLTARKKQALPFSSNLLLSGMQNSKLIVGEDVAILEKVQSALHENAPLPNQGVYEVMNRRIERWYATLMENDDEL